ncbi:MAG: hypothetical protein E6H83_03440 [Chloroflexi bacterium]|nr:MAG: hypothetical protein E6H83_03440 [Chloroflexota bacterium]
MRSPTSHGDAAGGAHQHRDHHPFTELFGCFTDPIEAIRDDVRRLIEYKSLVHRDKVRGFLYDLATNTLAEVKGTLGVP